MGVEDIDGLLNPAEVADDLLDKHLDDLLCLLFVKAIRQNLLSYCKTIGKQLIQLL